MKYNKLNNFYLALTDKEFFRLPLNFLSNGFHLRLDYQLVFGKMNPQSSVNLLKQVFKQWNTHLDKQTLGITKKLIWVIKEQKLQSFFGVPCICMFRNEHRYLFRGCLALVRDQKSPERGNIANASGKEVDFARSMLDKQHEFNGTSLEVNKICRAFFWVVTLNRNSIKLFTRSSRNKRVHSRLA